MHRRDALTLIGTGSAGLAFGTAFTAPACPGGKSLTTQVLIITKSYSEIQPLLPELGLSQTAIDHASKLIADAIKVAEQFDKAYRDGAFENASTLFNNLSSLTLNIATELNAANNRIVKGVIAGVAVARIVIAALLEAQAANQPALRTAKKSAAMSEAVAEIERLNSVDIDRLLALVQ